VDRISFSGNNLVMAICLPLSRVEPQSRMAAKEAVMTTTQLAGVVGFSLLLVLLLWRRSPFYLPKAPQPEAGAATAAA
jgi:hypothetical protein